MHTPGGGSVTPNMNQRRNPAVQCMRRVKQSDDNTIHKHSSAWLRHYQPIRTFIANPNCPAHASVTE